MEDLKAKWIQLARSMNEKGIPIPVIRDPKTGTGSVSLTLVFISANLVIFGIIGKWGAGLKIDMEQAMQFFYATSALYFGRGLTAPKGIKLDPVKEEQILTQKSVVTKEEGN
jgi:hypothetical protein